MPRIQKQVIGEAKIGKLRDAATKLRAQHELVIRFSLHNMPKANKAAIALELRQLVTQSRRAKIDPTDNASDEAIFFCQAEQPASFIDTLLRLHRDRAIECISDE